MKKLFYGLLLVLGMTNYAYTVELCLTSREWPEPRPHIIEYWIDDSIWNESEISPYLSGRDAEELIKVTLERYYPETGAVKFQYMGRVTEENICDFPPNGNGKLRIDSLAVRTTPTNCASTGSYWARCNENGDPYAHVSIYTSQQGELNDCNFEGYDQGGFVSVFNHEVMHALDMHHAYECEETRDYITSTSSKPRDGNQLTLADKKHIRARWGLNTSTLKYRFSSPFMPYGDSYSHDPWSIAYFIYAASNVVSPISAASNYENYRGVVYNVPGPDYETNVRAYICDPDCSVETPSSYFSNGRPDIATSVLRGYDNRWMVVFMTGETETSTRKNIRIAERIHGTSSWSWTLLEANTIRSEINISYDYATDRFVIAYIDSNDSNGQRYERSDDRVVFLTRARTGGDWIRTEDLGLIEGSFHWNSEHGVDIACNAAYYWQTYFGQNCLAVGTSPDPEHQIQWLPFKVNQDGTVNTSIIRDYGIGVYSLPSVVANPVNGNEIDSTPEFLMVFSMLNNTIFTRRRGVNDMNWSFGGLAATHAGSDFLSDSLWFRGVGTGTRIGNFFPYNDYGYVYFAE